MDTRERYPDRQEELLLIGDALQGRMWTMLPGIVVKYFIQDNTPVASVKLAIKGYDIIDDGSKTFHDLPILPHCPVMFPRGGGYSITFPIKSGDECMVLFASRSIDEWWQSGTGQPPYDFRQHDLSDGICLVGLTSKSKPFKNINTSSLQIKSDNDDLLIELDNNQINIKAKSINIEGDVNIKGEMKASGDVIGGGISLKNHKHGGVQLGGEETGTPK